MSKLELNLTQEEIRSLAAACIVVVGRLGVQMQNAKNLTEMHRVAEEREKYLAIYQKIRDY